MGNLPCKKSFLIIEDDYVSYLLLFEYLSEFDIKVFHVNSICETIEFMGSSEEIDFILLDIKLSDGMAFDIVNALKSRYNNAKIIAQTALALDGDRKKCLDVGCDAYISKPIIFSQLLEVL